MVRNFVEADVLHVSFLVCEMLRLEHSHALQQTQRREEQRGEADGLEDEGLFFVGGVAGVVDALDLHGGAHDADGAEDGKVYPA